MALVMGAFLGISQYEKDEIPFTESIGLIISIASEQIGADIDVSCYVDGKGVVDVYFAAGEQLDQTAKIWVFVDDFFYSYEWKVNGFSVAELIPYEEYEK